MGICSCDIEQGDVEEVGAMTDKKFVRSIYPHAGVDPEYLSGYSVYWFEKNEAVSVAEGNSEEAVWNLMRLIVERRMLKKLEQ